MSIKELNREYLYSGKPNIAEKATEAGRKRFKPDPQAEGAHSVYRRDPVTGKVSHYETYRPQSNLFNPTPWETVKRVDNSGKVNQSHYNKTLEKHIFEPHVHNSSFPGGVRPAELWEIRKRLKVSFKRIHLLRKMFLC